MMRPDPIIQIRDLSVTFPDSDSPVTVVNGIDFEIAEAEILGIAGESGSGKSVSALSLTRLLPPDAELSGKVCFGPDELDLLKLSEKRLRSIRGSQIAYIFQEPSTAFNPVYTIGQQLMEALAHAGVPRSKRRDRAVAALDQMGIDAPKARMTAFPGEFSGGMLQRLAIAAALARQPKLLIADEPTTGLDAASRTLIIDLLKSIRGETGMTILFITHDIGCLFGFADRMLVMQSGHVVERGPTDSVLRNPQHPYARQLVESVPRLQVSHGKSVSRE